MTVYLYLQAAAKYLQEEADKWEDECNPVVQVAMEMSNQMQQMMDMCRREEKHTEVECTENCFSSVDICKNNDMKWIHEPDEW